MNNFKIKEKYKDFKIYNKLAEMTIIREYLKRM